MTPPIVSNADPNRVNLRQFTASGKTGTLSPVVAIHGWDATGATLIAAGIITDVVTPSKSWTYAVPPGETWVCQFVNVQIAPSGGDHLITVLEPK